MKKHLLLLLVALLPVVASAYNAKIDGIYYNFSGDKAIVTSGSPKYSGAVVIPASVTYNSETYSVTSIGNSAFFYCDNLTSITIPNSVTRIGIGAFYNCSGLTSITIPNSVTSIDNSAFHGCSSLTSIIVESGNTVYDSRNDCNAIIETETNTLIVGCQNTIIPNSVTSIGNYAFYHCSGLTSITIPNSVTSIGSEVFYGCSGLTSITIPESVTSIGVYAFSMTGWYNAQPDGILYLDNWLLGYKGPGPTGNVTIKSGTRGIVGSAFSGCSGLTSVIIGNSVTSIGDRAFYACSGLTSIKVDTGNQYYDSRGNCNAIIETASNTLITGCMNTIIPDGVTSIGGSAFEECSGLTSITIPNSVTSIGEYAFQGCSGLTSITIPNSVTSIGYSAFSGCSSLTSVTIPESVTSIGGSAFYGCSGLTSITIPESVTSIDYYAFAYCSGLKDIYCYAENVPSTNIHAFYDSPISSATLHVPASSVNAYKTTAPWSNFGQIVAINAIKETCTIPTISYANGKLTFNCETEDVIFHSTITDTDITSYLTQEVELCVTYTISVYASKPGYEDSEVATGTLCWIDQQPNTEGIIAEDAVTEVKALPVLIQNNGGTITVQGANEGTEISVYSVNGMKQGSAIATQGLAAIETTLRPGSVVVVKIGDKAVKVLIK